MIKTRKTPNFLQPLALAFFLAIASTTAIAASIDNTTRISLQSELRSYIETKTSNGTYTFFDEEDGSIQEFNIKAIHPVIFAKDDRFLMCADFVDQKGKKVLIDYVMLPVGDGFIVEKELEGQRSRLMTMFEKLL